VAGPSADTSHRLTKLPDKWSLAREVIDQPRASFGEMPSTYGRYGVDARSARSAVLGMAFRTSHGLIFPAAASPVTAMARPKGPAREQDLPYPLDSPAAPSAVHH